MRLAHNSCMLIDMSVILRRVSHFQARQDSYKQDLRLPASGYSFNIRTHEDHRCRWINGGDAQFSCLTVEHRNQTSTDHSNCPISHMLEPSCRNGDPKGSQHSYQLWSLWGGGKAGTRNEQGDCLKLRHRKGDMKIYVHCFRSNSAKG
jgi:hypothetical protein